MESSFLVSALKRTHVFRLSFYKQLWYSQGQFGRKCARQAYQTSCEALVYRTHGHYKDVLHLEKVPLHYVGDEDIHIRMLAAPVNPADINMLQGTYGIIPSLPAIGGNEGVGKVLNVGSEVHNIKPGDWVIPVKSCFGTWRTEAVCKSSEVISVPKDMSVISAATLGVNPCTAYRMLMDFVSLQPGDTIIQNGANSAVGQAVIQICASMGINTINVIRDRPNINNLIDKLHFLGANYVITERNSSEAEMGNIFKVVPRPILALNCIGGSSAGSIFTHLQDGSTMVTYGGMSKKPTPLPAKAMIFQNIKICGFWMTQWKQNHKHDLERLKTMVCYLSDMVQKGKLLEPLCKQVPFYDYNTALQASMEMYSRKYVLRMD
ncbi:enoyl-[acyl-carrier-protein] reductase, mitochondrial [Bombina bombina]|uniref:enoyl-[acyl-carrier-protein] reductase, mitochondrial n=1 Tax=Bombina bombina TaxID=8345 RepID=UPI00235ABEEF|nr:enoyl-[acyl-carrier-protein] reductase, mitochondrial [Bombina bombina]